MHLNLTEAYPNHSNQNSNQKLKKKRIKIKIHNNNFSQKILKSPSKHQKYARFGPKSQEKAKKNCKNLYHMNRNLSKKFNKIHIRKKKKIKILHIRTKFPTKKYKMTLDQNPHIKNDISTPF